MFYGMSLRAIVQNRTEGSGIIGSGIQTGNQDDDSDSLTVNNPVSDEVNVNDFNQQNQSLYDVVNNSIVTISSI